MLYSHDAATGKFVNLEHIKAKNIAFQYIVTQTTGITGQLQCGARGFDLRVQLWGNELWTNHGIASIDYRFIEILDELKNWQMAHRNVYGVDDIIVVTLHCDDARPWIKSDDACWSNVKYLVEGYGLGDIEIDHGKVPVVVNGMQTTKESTVGDIKKMNQWGILVTQKFHDNYDDTIEPYSFTKGPADEEIWDRLKYHVLNVASTGGDSNANGVWQVQAHWQYGVTSVAKGTVELSTIVLDQRKGHVNDKMRDLIYHFEHLSLLGVDDVCDQGPVLAQILKERNVRTAIANQGQNGGRRRLESRLAGGEA
jgi:hypothetical protein